MTDNLDRLFEAAKAAQAHAYAPYSKFSVGAALLTVDGRIFSGCNVENASYPEGLCAESAAIAAMIASGARQIAAILVISPNEIMITPCGGCRQRIREFASDSTIIHCASQCGIEKSLTVNGLLPQSFGPDNFMERSLI